MRITFLLLLLAQLMGANHLSARMFSTVKECDMIYGKPTAPTDKTSDVRFYKHDGLTIKILFAENKAAVITYNSLTSLKIGPEAQQKLLNENSGGNQWEEVVGEGARTWQRSDGQAFAIYDNATGELNMFSTDYIEKSKAEVQSAINEQ